MKISDTYIRLAQHVPGRDIVDLVPSGTYEPKNDGALKGIPFAIQNNIALKGFRLTCGSKALENYISPYTATAVNQLISAGAMPVCTANMDEFGMTPAKSANSPFSGSAALVASGCVPLALSSDTVGDARISAAHYGVFGMKPTYGAYSRFGLTACASSMEQISLIGCDLDQMRKAHLCLSSKKDPLDMMQKSLPPISEKFCFPGKKIALLDTDGQAIYPAIGFALQNAAEIIGKAGADIVTCRMERFHLIVPAFYALACAETSANMARLTGLFSETSEEAASEMDWEMNFAQYRTLLGTEVQKRITLGAYILCEDHYEKFYARAQQYRRMLNEWFDHLFQECSLLLLPVVSAASPMGKSGEDSSIAWTACANLAGLPAITIPWGRDEKDCPVAIQLIAPEGRDSYLFDAAEAMMKAKESL